MQSLGESNNQNNVLTMMKSGLLRLEEKRDENKKWTIESFSLLCYIITQEASEIQVQLLQGPKDFTRHTLKEKQGNTATSTIENKERKNVHIAKVNIGVMNVYVTQISIKGEIS